MGDIASIEAGTSIAGAIAIPGDKSISHRALMFSAVAVGNAAITNLSPGRDVQSTARALQALGVELRFDNSESVHVSGRGFSGLRAPEKALDCGNSGTTMRLMMGLLAGRQFSSQLIGDASLSQRPMGRISTPLKAMGAQFELRAGERPPVTVHGGPLTGIEYHSPVASAQVKTAVILAGLQANGLTVVSEDVLSRDHTERMLWAMDAPLTAIGTSIRVQAGPLRPLGEYNVPGDLSSAAFFLAAGLLLDGPGLTVENVGLNPSRTGFLDAIASMGVHVTVTEGVGAGEPVGNLTVNRCALRPLHLKGGDLVRAIDEVPILAVLATQAHGQSVIADAAELRVKESDRLAATSRFLNAMGAQVIQTPDGLIIDGPTPLHHAEVETHHDHRIAMAAAVAGLLSGVTIDGASCADVSYPGFFDILSQVTDACVQVNT